VPPLHLPDKGGLRIMINKHTWFSGSRGDAHSKTRIMLLKEILDTSMKNPLNSFKYCDLTQKFAEAKSDTGTLLLPFGNRKVPVSTLVTLFLILPLLER
jgi:hypothetical protein